MGSVAWQRFRGSIRGIRTPTGRVDTLQGGQGIHDHPPGALGDVPCRWFRGGRIRLSDAGGGRGSKEGGVQMLNICKRWGDPQSSLRGETMGGKERGEGEKRRQR